MKKYEVTIRVYYSRQKIEDKTVTVEAGNKKQAYLAALRQLESTPGTSGLYKDVMRIEEVE